MQVLSKYNDRSIDDMFVSAILVRALNRISKSMQPANVPPPPTSWLVKCLIHRAKKL